MAIANNRNGRRRCGGEAARRGGSDRGHSRLCRASLCSGRPESAFQTKLPAGQPDFPGRRSPQRGGMQMPKPNSRSRPRLLGSVFACLALAVSGLLAGVSGASVAHTSAVGLAAAPAAAAAAAGSSCSAAYSVQTDWGSGFTANLVVTNNGTTTITVWTVTYANTGNQTLANGWSGNWTQSGKTVTVTNAAWNGNLAAGANTQLGANFNYSGSNTPPATVTCTPAGGTTTPT